MYRTNTYRETPVTWPPKSFENILTAMDYAHASRVTVIIIQHTNLAPESATFRKGTGTWELHDEVKHRHADVIIEKTMPDSFAGTRLGEWLQEQKISTVTIAGYMTQMCCDTTARAGIPPEICSEFPLRCDRDAFGYQLRGIGVRHRPSPGDPCHQAMKFSRVSRLRNGSWTFEIVQKNIVVQ